MTLFGLIVTGACEMAIRHSRGTIDVLIDDLPTIEIQPW